MECVCGVGGYMVPPSQDLTPTTVLELENALHPIGAPDHFVQSPVVPTPILSLCMLQPLAQDPPSHLAAY